MFSIRKFFWNTKEIDWSYKWKTKKKDWRCSWKTNHDFKNFTDKKLNTFGSLFPKDALTIEARDWIEKTKEIEQEINRGDLIYKTGNKKKEWSTWFWKKLK